MKRLNMLTEEQVKEVLIELKKEYDGDKDNPITMFAYYEQLRLLSYLCKDKTLACHILTKVDLNTTGIMLSVLKQMLQD